MKKIKLFTLAALSLCAAVFTSCEEDTPLTSKTKLFPAFNEATEKYGYINNKGEWAIDAQYDYVSTFSCKLAYVMMGNTEGFIDKNGTFTPVPASVEMNDEHFFNGLAIVSNKDGDKLGFINTDMEIVVQPMFEELDILTNGLAVASIDGDKYGYINEKGEWIIQAQFYDAASFSEDMAPVQLSEDGKIGYINKKGKLEIDPLFDHSDGFYDGLARFIEFDDEDEWDYKFGFINKKGETVIQPMLEYATIFSDNNLCPASIDGEKMGYINKKGEMEIPAIYEEAYPFSNGLGFVYNDDKVGVIDTKGNYTISPKYDFSASDYFYNGLALMVKNNDDNSELLYIDKDDNVVFSWKMEYEDYAPAKTSEPENKLRQISPIEREGHFTLGVKE